MKFVLSFMLAISIFMLMSCGDKPASSKLSVSFGFTGSSLVSTSYPGGIVFYGRSSTNKVFSAPLLGQNNQVQIDLDKGVWTLGAVGWTGQSILNGTTKCALLKNVTIDTDEKTIELNLNSPTCADSEFGTNWLSSEDKFKELGIITCGIFPQSFNSDTPSYCSPSAIEAEFRTHAKSASVEIPSFPNGTTELKSCIDLTDDQQLVTGMKLVTGVNIPSKGLPVEIKLFETSCSDTVKKPMTGYLFPIGLNFNYRSQFDHNYFATITNGAPTSSNLYLLATDSRRGKTFFRDSFPKFKCDTITGSSCNTIPALPSGVDRVVEANVDFYVGPANGVSCDEGTFTIYRTPYGTDIMLITPFESVPLTTSNCNTRNGKIFVRLQENQIKHQDYFCSTQTPCKIEFTFNGSTMNPIFFIKSLAPEISALNLLYKTVGHEEVTTAADGKNSLVTLFQDEFTSGVLTTARKVMGPGLIGGMLSPIAISNLVDNLTFNFDVFEDGVKNTYQIKSFKLNRANIPPFIANATNDTFDNQITVSIPRAVPLLPQPFIILKYKKNKRIGMMEQIHYQLESNNRSTTYRSLTYWNTDTNDSDRTESYTFRQEKNGNLVLSTDVSFSRAERDNVGPQLTSGIFSSGSGLRVEEYQFSSKKDCDVTPCNNNYKQNGSKKLLLLNGPKAKFAREVFNISDPNPLKFFNDSLSSGFRKSPDATGSNSASAKSPNGEYLIRAWSEKSASEPYVYNLRVVVKKKGVQKSETLLNSLSLTALNPKVLVGNDGRILVSYVKKVLETIGTVDYPIYKLMAHAGPGLNFGQLVTRLVTVGSDPINLPVAVIDQDPLNTTCSEKTIVFSSYYVSQDGTSPSGFYIKSNTFNCPDLVTDTSPSWGEDVPLVSDSSVSNIQVLKHIISTQTPPINYYISYQIGNVVKVLRTTTIQESPSSPLFTERNLSYTGSSFKMIVNGNSVDLVEISPNGLLMLSSGINNDTFATNPITGVSLNLGAFEPIQDAFLENSEFCFDRSIVSASPATLNSNSTNFSCSDFLVPNTSHSDPIRSQFKYNIDSLKPSEFLNVFEIP